jgi:hypothetical protein
MHCTARHTISQVSIVLIKPEIILNINVDGFHAYGHPLKPGEHGVEDCSRWTATIAIDRSVSKIHGLLEAAKQH